MQNGSKEVVLCPKKISDIKKVLKFSNSKYHMIIITYMEER